MDSLKKKRRTQTLAIAGVVVLLVGMIAFNILRPSPEEKAEADFTEKVLAGDTTKLPRNQRQELQHQWERFSPESRKKIFFEVARSRLQEFRDKTAELSPEEKSRAIRKAVEDMRQQRARLGEAEKARIRQRLATGEAKEMTQNFMSFYHQELSAKERSELDPLVHEWLKQVDELMHE
jgi:hypothetical protein